MNSQSGWESITRFSAINNVSIFHVIKQIIRKILIVYFAIVRYILWEINVEETFDIQRAGLKIAQSVCCLTRERIMVIL